MGRSVSILGLNAYHGDSSACLVVDGRIVAAVEEERFRRVKHWAGFPAEAARYCLAAGGIDIADLDHVAINRDPSANLMKKVLFTLKTRPDIRAIGDRLKNASHVHGAGEALAEACGVGVEAIGADVHRIEHHRAHLASSFLASPFEEAAILSVDGFGDFLSTLWGYGRGTRMTTLDKVAFPHSLGLFYLAITQLLGFDRYGDEYKVMGLAPYGEPEFLDEMRTVVRKRRSGRFELDLECFVHHSEGVSMVWDGGSPVLGRAFSDELVKRFPALGGARSADEPVTQVHRNLAASAQAVYEETLFHVLEQLAIESGFTKLCLSGGCAMNSVANGKITENTPFDEIWVPPAPGDAGGAVGAALAVWNQALGQPRVEPMLDPYLGPGYTDAELGNELFSSEGEIARRNCRVRRLETEELVRTVAERLADGAVVGWFQGRMEWGPRALGARSILGDPRRSDMRDLLNAKIKRRESFRPFAPSVLREAVPSWFEKDGDVPFMSEVWQVRADKREHVPAITHVDGSGRLQSVSDDVNPLYHRLIEAFRDLTGVPMLLNTSFNENEPVVCRPSEALDCFLRTKMDLLVLGNHVVERLREPAGALPRSMPDAQRSAA